MLWVAPDGQQYTQMLDNPKPINVSYHPVVRILLERWEYVMCSL